MNEWKGIKNEWMNEWIYNPVGYAVFSALK